MKMEWQICGTSVDHDHVDDSVWLLVLAELPLDESNLETTLFLAFSWMVVTEKRRMK